MNKPQKSTNLIISEEIDLFENSLISLIQNSQLPISVIKIVLQSTTTNLINMFDRTIESEKNKYYSALSEYETEKASQQNNMKEESI